MLPALFALVFLGVPVGFALILVGVGFAAPVFGEVLPRQVLARVLEIPQQFAFAAVPAFVLMGALLERSGLAEKLFAAMRLLLGRLPGGWRWPHWPWRRCSRRAAASSAPSRWWWG